MKIAVNFSPHLLQSLPRNPEIWVKISDWNSLWQVDAVHKVIDNPRFLIHLTLVPGSPTPVHQSGSIWTDLLELVRRVRPPYLSAHIGFRQRVDYAPDGRYRFGEALTDDAIIANTRRNLAILTEATGLETILENQTVVYGDGLEPPYVGHCAHPDFVSRMVNETETGFLLDLAHARVNAHFFGMSLEDYVRRCPMQRLREIHISGCRQLENGRLADTHAECGETDYQLLEELISHQSPEFLTLEYDQSQPALERQIERLFALSDPGALRKI